MLNNVNLTQPAFKGLISKPIPNTKRCLTEHTTEANDKQFISAITRYANDRRNKVAVVTDHTLSKNKAAIKIKDFIIHIAGFRDFQEKKQDHILDVTIEMLDQSGGSTWIIPPAILGREKTEGLVNVILSRVNEARTTMAEQFFNKLYTGK